MLKNLSAVIIVLFIALSSIKAQVKSNISGPHAIVYKTKGDYRHMVPVLLSADKTAIVSYPHPQDMKIHGRYALPTSLHQGYMLDNRGIGLNVAFLKMTYEEYGALQQAPTIQELYKMIIDKDPLSVYCDCGKRSSFKNPVKDINNLIDKKRLRQKCKQIK